MEFYVQCPKFSLAMQAMNETLLIFPNSGISDSLSPPLSPHTKLYLSRSPHQRMADDRFITLYKS